jgi:hypothetical protein
LLWEVSRLVHSRRQKFLRNVHNLFTHALVSSSPAGLRLEIAFEIDKKKNEKKEFYFSARTKIFLTRKEKRTCPRENKKFLRLVFARRSDISIHTAVAGLLDLTELTRASNFPASRVSLDGDQNAGDAHEDREPSELER